MCGGLLMWTTAQSYDEKEVRAMLRNLRTIHWLLLVACLMLIQSCGEEAYYDIVVVNDAWLFGTCSIYLDGEFQFELDVEESDVIMQVKEGKHTIMVKDISGDVIAKQTFDVSQDQKWAVSDHFYLDWVFD